MPDEIGTYGEGQRYVGVYVLNKVSDPDASTPDHEVPQYVTVLAPPTAGLPFDFDQVRVFTWSTRHHRYETAFRLHPIQGYLPVRVTPGSGGSAPVFSFQIPSGPNMTIDPETGVTRPASPRTITYMMVDTQVRRTGSDLGPIPSPTRKARKPSREKPGKRRLSRRGCRCQILWLAQNRCLMFPAFSAKTQNVNLSFCAAYAGSGFAGLCFGWLQEWAAWIIRNLDKGVLF